MNRLRRPLTPLCIVLACALPMLAASPAGAGIRDRIKSVKDKATGQPPAAGAAGSAPPPAFDGRTLELTGPRLDQVLAGFRASAAATADRPKLVARQEQLQKEVDALQEKHGGTFAEYAAKRDEHRECLRSGVQEQHRERIARMMQAGQVDPRSIETLARLSVRVNEAQIAGDTATVRKLGVEVDRIVGVTKEDTLAARKACGPDPTPPPAMARFDAATAEQGATLERLRGMEFAAVETRVKASGMTEDQLAIATDRILLYLAAVKGRREPAGFTDTELQALAARRDALAAALGA